MIILDLPKPPSTNALFLNVPRKGRVKTPEYRAWLTEAGLKLIVQRPRRIAGPVNIELLFSDEGRVDLDNLTKATLDILVSHRIIEDDKRSIVRKLSCEWSNEVTGCRVQISEATN